MAKITIELDTQDPDSVKHVYSMLLELMIIWFKHTMIFKVWLPEEARWASENQTETEDKSTGDETGRI